MPEYSLKKAKTECNLYTDKVSNAALRPLFRNLVSMRLYKDGVTSKPHVLKKVLGNSNCFQIKMSGIPVGHWA